MFHHKSPFLVGNLWDVTDKDIDKVTKVLLEKILSGDNIGNVLDLIFEAKM